MRGQQIPPVMVPRWTRQTDLIGDVVNQFTGVTFASSCWFSAYVVEIPRAVIPLTQDLELGGGQQRKELFKESNLALFGELVIQSPQARPQHGPPVIDVLAGREPESNAVKVANGQHESLQTMCIGHIFHGGSM